jgi:DGQHR domain-containing protein
MSIKEIVFEYVHSTKGCIDYEELTELVFSFNSRSAWNITHWNYYRSQITLPHGRYFNSFIEIERSNLMDRVKLVDNQKPAERTEETKSKTLYSHTMSKKIVRPASMVKQGGLILYATSLKVADLIMPNFYTIERLDPENAKEKGYQRLLNKGRAKKLADYIIAGQETKDAFLPTSIFLATNKSISFNPANNTLEIDIDDIGPFNVVDGQHRVEGLKMAAERDDRVLEFEVPVNIAVNLSEIEQMCHFLIVNTTQKSVEEGVAQRIRARLTKSLGVDDTPNLPKWIYNSVQKGEDEKALQFVDFLNYDKDSPWHNKIRMANDDNNDGTVNQKSFVKAIKKYILVVNNPVYNTEKEDRQHRIFLNYWKALTNILGTDEPTVLFKYNGVELFCKFCVPFLNKIVNMADYKVSTMQNLLEMVFENVEGDGAGVGHTDFWVKGGTASGLNAGALSKINTEMIRALHKPTELKSEKEMEI